MRLSQRERDIFYCAQLQATAPVSKLRELTGYRDHSIRYCLQRALERQLIAPRCFVDLSLLGYLQFEIFFSLSSEKKQSREGLLKALRESEKVSWMGELGGDYQYGINICARGIEEVSEFLDQLSSRYGQIFLEKQIAIRVSLTYFGNKYLSEQRLQLEPLRYSVTKKRAVIDELDHRILTTIMEYSHSSRRLLAQKLGIPLSTLDYRIKRLEQQGVIGGYYYMIKPEELGVQSFLLLVSVRGIDREVQQLFYTYCKQHPNIVLFIHSLGSWDFELVVEVEDSRDITPITEDLRDRFSGQLQFLKVLPMFAYSKVKEYPFRTFVAAGE